MFTGQHASDVRTFAQRPVYVWKPKIAKEVSKNLGNRQRKGYEDVSTTYNTVCYLKINT